MSAEQEPPKRRLLQHLVEKGRFQPLSLYVSWIGVLLGIVWVLLHPVATVTTAEPKTRGTYFSENAMLADTMTASISDTHAAWAKNYHREYINFESTDDNGCDLHSTCTHVIDWIESKLHEIPGVEVYRQVYTQHLYDSEYLNRTNVYAVLRGAPLVDGKESIVLVAQYPNVPATNKNGYSALSVGLAMLRYLDNKKWLAKDLILLLTDDGPNDGRDGYSPGVEAWLKAYHSSPFSSSALEMHAGVIRGAIILETSKDNRKYNAVGIFGAGMNGQLPNLDLINVAVETLENERLSVFLDRCADSSIECDDILTWLHSWLLRVMPEESHDYVSRLLTLFRFMKTLATGPSGSHANFIHYNIDAITLTALHADNNGASLRLVNWMRSIESVIRAVSNLEEKFHQSFYFYLLVSARTFVSIGEYYYPMVLMLLPLFANTLFYVTNTGGLRTAFAVSAFVVAVSLGSVLLLLTTHLSLLDPLIPLLDLARSHHDTLSHTYCWTLVGVTCLMQCVAVVWILPRLSQFIVLEGCVDESQWLRQIHDHRKEFQATRPEQDQDKDLISPIEPFETDEGWRAVKVLLAIFVILVHCAVGIFNYSFALVCTLPMTILIALASPLSQTSMVQNTAYGIILVVLSPVVLLQLLELIQPAAMDGLAYFINGFARHGLLAVPYFCWVYFPVHTLAMWIWFFKKRREDSP
ncbi:hypothetical protein AeMF1_003888 [Aphanomyces euteiches]|nr:hypothetical protein AeMF1_003888 [Aphanomyces euteiches]KAH9191746.1 hypothetical protein AeNC1_006278 [Aphanomyces euteiches]